LPVSAGSASGVKPSPLGFDRVYVHILGKFGYMDWFRALKSGRSFATNGPMLFLTANGREPGGAVVFSERNAGKATKRRLQVRVEASSSHNLERVEVVWKGKVVKTLTPAADSTDVSSEFGFEPDVTGWLAARAFEKSASSASVHFAATSPIYVQVGTTGGVVSDDARYFVGVMDEEIKFYQGYQGFRSEADRQAMLELFRRARAVYERLAGERDKP